MSEKETNSIKTSNANTQIKISASRLNLFWEHNSLKIINTFSVFICKNCQNQNKYQYYSKYTIQLL